MTDIYDLVRWLLYQPDANEIRDNVVSGGDSNGIRLSEFQHHEFKDNIVRGFRYGGIKIQPKLRLWVRVACAALGVILGCAIVDRYLGGVTPLFLLVYLPFMLLLSYKLRWFE